MKINNIIGYKIFIFGRTSKKNRKNHIKLNLLIKKSNYNSNYFIDFAESDFLLKNGIINIKI